MWFCPTVVVDGFFQNPDSIVSLANTLEYKPSHSGSWPGKRSKPLDECCPELYEAMVDPILRTVMRIPPEPDDFRVQILFQKVSSAFEEGWIHQDHSIDMTSIIYLSPSLDGVDIGTSVYKIKDDSFPKHYFNEKKKAFNSKNIKSSTKYREMHNSYYEPTLNIRDRYNRLAVFDPKQYHAANSFEGVEGDGERLTIVGFWQFRNARTILDQCKVFEF